MKRQLSNTMCGLKFAMKKNDFEPIFTKFLLLLSLMRYMLIIHKHNNIFTQEQNDCYRAFTVSININVTHVWRILVTFQAKARLPR